MDTAQWANSRVVSDDLRSEVARPKSGSGKDIGVFGSGVLGRELRELGRFDEERIGLVPVALGRATPLFRWEEGRTDLRIVEARPLGAKCLLLRCVPDSTPT
jgi:dihydrofolate reductase